MKHFLYKTGFYLRRIVPEGLKIWLRLAKLGISPYPPAAPVVPQSLLEECRLINSREALLGYLPKNGVIGEIGTLYGDFSQKIIDSCKPRKFHLFDLDFSRLRANVTNNPAVRLHRGHSVSLLQGFDDECFDWLYVDGDHSYEGVKADIAAAKRKIKPGGLLVFNDFARIIPTGFGTLGVHQAVCEFAVKENWKFVYFCLQGNALYDVALRKPGNE